MAKGGELYVYTREHIGDTDRRQISDAPLNKERGSIRSIRFRMDTDYLTRTLSYKMVSDGATVGCDTDTSDCDTAASAIHEPTTESPGYTHFTTLENVNYLCDEGLKKGKRFTGALVGMYAYRGDGSLRVRFHHDLYSDRG